MTFKSAVGAVVILKLKGYILSCFVLTVLKYSSKGQRFKIQTNIKNIYTD